MVKAEEHWKERKKVHVFKHMDNIKMIDSLVTGNNGININLLNLY